MKILVIGPFSVFIFVGRNLVLSVFMITGFIEKHEKWWGGGWNFMGKIKKPIIPKMIGFETKSCVEYYLTSWANSLAK